MSRVVCRPIPRVVRVATADETLRRIHRCVGRAGGTVRLQAVQFQARDLVARYGSTAVCCSVKLPGRFYRGMVLQRPYGASLGMLYWWLLCEVGV